MTAALRPRRYPLIYLMLALALLLSFLTAVGLGAVRWTPWAVARALAELVLGRGGDSIHVIVKLRLVRSLLAAVIGASLAGSGAVLQGLFRNPLADPYVIGSSSGAAFGAVVVLSLGLEVSFFGFSSIGGAAFLGGIAATLIVYLVAGASRIRSDAASLLLAGTALSSFFSALVSVILAIKDKNLHQVFFWLMGGFSGRGMSHLLAALPALLVGFIAAMASARVLDILSSGDESAASFGMRPARVRLIVGGFAALAVSAAVSVAGAIGFVGLVAPHLARRFVGPVHRRLIPASALIGAIMLLLSDAVARTAFAPIEMPVGAITALIGAPFFLYKIARRGLDGVR
ncbi:MAG: iron ABC transporter permease [Spirochaetes bacterium]|nr:iron ABC transporter permease [Spirochaetota bacterium]MBU0957013.1 iron ABC transporter permease [Spirochaetota bacterium]